MLKFKIVNTIFLLLIVLLAIVKLFVSVPIFVFLLLFILWITITAIGSFNILWNYHLTAYHKNNSVSDKIVAITFDDGPHPVYTLSVLKLLKKFNAKATFFCVGKEVEKYPDIVKKIIGQGHLIGNHTYSHSNTFGFMNAHQIINEINTTDKIINAVTLKKPLLFRPPFGVTNPSIAKAIQKTKHQVIGWSVRSLDTVLKTDKKIVNRIVKKLKTGDIILLHDTSEKTVIALEQLLLILQQEHYKIVTVDVLLNGKTDE